MTDYNCPICGAPMKLKINSKGEIIEGMCRRDGWIDLA